MYTCVMSKYSVTVKILLIKSLRKLKSETIHCATENVQIIIHISI